MFTPMTSPSHFIVGGLQGNEGVVISRDYDKVKNTRWLSDEDWFLVQTNSDVWIQPDSRYEHAYTDMENMTQSKVQLDGISIVKDVLFQQGVIQDDTIFTSTITANSKQPIVMYDSPNYYNSHYAWQFALPSESFATIY